MSASVASDTSVSDVPIPGAHPPDATAPGDVVATTPTVAKAWPPWHPFEKYVPAQHPVGVHA